MSNLGSAVAELIPLGLVIALSPFSIIPGILVLHTPRPRPTSMSFLAGWVLGIATITAVCAGASDLSKGSESSSAWTPYVRIAIGIGLIAWGLYRWLTRNRPAHTPAWMRSLTSIRPGRAFLTGLVLTVVNPKVLFMCVAAGAVIGTTGLSLAQSSVALTMFIVIAASSVGLPALGYLVAGERLDEPLNKLKTWMEDNHAALIGAILILIGLALLYKGIHAL